VAIARQQFRLPEDGPNLRIAIGDAVEYVATKERRWDLVIVDGYDAQGRPGMLDSEPFYVNCRARLAKEGLVSVNLLARTRGAKASLDRLRRAFDDRVLVLPPSEAGNIVAIAGLAPILEAPFSELRAHARALHAKTGLDFAPLLARIEESPR
jgi:spermidine synthase